MPETKQLENEASAKMKILIRGMATYVESIHGRKNPEYLSPRASYIDGYTKGYHERMEESKQKRSKYSNTDLQELAIVNYEANELKIEEEKDKNAISFTFGYLAGYTLLK